MRSYKDFLRIKQILERFNDEDDEDDEYLPQIYNDYLIDYDGEGYTPTKKEVYFRIEDVSNGELVPELYESFDANIIANDIGLKTLKYFPSLIVKKLDISENEIVDLKYCPSIIDGDFICDTNKITSLENGPTSVHGSFICSNNFLTDLKGFPNEVDEDIDLSGNIYLTCLEGLPKKHFYRLDLSGCISLKDLKHCPRNVDHLHLDNVPINSLRDLIGKEINTITGFNQISEIEIDFFFAKANMPVDSNFNYDQALVDDIIELIDSDMIDIEELNKIYLDLDKIKIEDKYLNMFKSAKTINKFNL